MIEHVLVFDGKSKIYESAHNAGFDSHFDLMRKITHALTHVISHFTNDKFKFYEIKNYKVEYAKTTTGKEFIITSKNDKTFYANKVLEIYSQAMLFDDFGIFTDEIERMMRK